MKKPAQLSPARWRRVFVLALFASASATVVRAADAAPAEAAATDNTTVGEIIVTATKRSENLQDVPISIQALTPLSLEQHQVASFDDYAKLLPSVSFQSFGPGQSQLFFRGISSGGDGLHGGSQPATSTYIDETPLTTIANGVDLHIYDVQRVEALSGPQGTLYGASSLSGTLRVITNQPNPTAFSAGVALEGNKFGPGTGGGTVEGYVNIPLGPKAAIRLVGFDEEDGGYIDNVLNSRTYDVDDGAGGTTPVAFNNAALVKKDFNTVSTHGGRAALKVDLTDNWTILPTVIFQDQTAKGDFLYDPRLGHLKVSDFQPSLNVDKWYDAALTIQGKIADWDVLYSGSYFSRKVDNHADYSYYSVYYNSIGITSVVTFPDGNGGFIDPDQAFTGHDDYLKNSHELRISSPSDKRFRIMGGLFTQWQSDSIYANYLVPGALASGTGVTVPGFGDDLFYTHIHRVDRDSAIFTNFDLDILPNLTFTGGIRGFKVNNSLYGFSGGGGAATDPTCLTTTSPTLPCVNVNKRAKDSGETHKLSLAWKMDPKKTVYFTYSTGFRPGGANRRPGVNAYVPDTLSNYELGWKTTWLDGKLRINGALFLEDWKNLQYGLSPIGNDGITNIYNAGNARSKGVEASITWKPADHWTISASGTHVDAKLTTDFCNFDTFGNPDCSHGVAAKKGDRLPVQPVFKANATVRYDFDVRSYQSFLQAASGTQTKTRSFLTDAEAASFGSPPGFTTMDFSAGFGKDKWTFQVFLTNAFDEKGILSYNAVCSPTFCGQWKRAYPIKPQFFGAKFAQDF